jgi:hypothetical protein
MVQWESAYLPALFGLPVGAILGLALTTATGRGRSLGAWDARATIPLLLAAAVAHLALLLAVEPLRIVMFTIYALAILVTVALAVAGKTIWRLAAVLLPIGSIGGYFLFAFIAHQADVVGLLVKLVEVATVVSALVPVLRGRQAREGWSVG